MKAERSRVCQRRQSASGKVAGGSGAGARNADIPHCTRQHLLRCRAGDGVVRHGRHARSSGHIPGATKGRPDRCLVLARCAPSQHLAVAHSHQKTVVIAANRARAAPFMAAAHPPQAPPCRKRGGLNDHQDHQRRVMEKRMAPCATAPQRKERHNGRAPLRSFPRASSGRGSCRH